MILKGWKDIANYVGVGVRTIQRWENECGLPVRRPNGKVRSAVLALSGELDAWTQSCAMRKHGLQTSDAPMNPNGNLTRLVIQGEKLWTLAQELQVRAMELQSTVATTRALQEVRQRGDEGFHARCFRLCSHSDVAH